jgi:uncharacterized membrane protein YozB (DUF420 family)
MTVYDLPPVNAFLNGMTAIFLMLGLYSILNQHKRRHMVCMVSALVTSTIFLGCYLYYHFHAGATKFEYQGTVRYVYFFILITHTILATANLPMIIITFYRAFTGNWEKHRKIARYTWPIWMYVSVTGVIIYFMLYQWFPGNTPVDILN